MYGKHFESMYDGSMYGAGMNVFAVWGWVISHAHFGRVEINPRKLADTLGGDVKDIEAAIKFLTSPDPRSRHKTHEGRRLVKEGEYQYFIPSWEDYDNLRKAEHLRAYNRNAKRKEREGKANGKSAREMVNESVRNDPITKSDAAAVRVLNEKGAESKALPGDKHFDLDYPAPEQPES